MSFSGDLNTFASKTKIRMDTVVRKVVIDMTKELVEATPVRTGHARSNWFFGAERITNVDPAQVKSGSPSLARAAQFAANLKAGGVFYIVNNVPYIMALEYGHSQVQAPAGMARITVARWKKIVEAVV